ncbi:MAG: membrane protein insertion efficiency factor YidD [Bacteroidetes bacterium]|nr:membrane protein insertion efficiency factor YidD [Bacteroidota bacterium]MCB9042651.1 membrane protein insertion efficiency factor YidD [Chitinophagales bacterium]
MENKQVGAFARYNPITLMLKGSMWMYQNAFSPQLGKRCSFEMSCSNFSKNSIKEYGIFKGLALSADRILRCNKISYLDISPLEIDEHSHRIKDFPIDYRWQKSEVAAE